MSASSTRLRYSVLVWLLFFLGSSWVTESAGQELIRAAQNGRLDRVEALVSEDPATTDLGDGSGYTPLRWAGIRGNGDVAAFLIGAGADPNSVGADGGTPLHGAAHHDDPAMMKALLSAGGDFSARNRWGRTPLHVAARRGCLDVARVLLDAGADPNATTNEGWTTLNVAYQGGHPRMVELLLARGADPKLADREGLVPGEKTLDRPEPVPLSRRVLDEYVGRYDLGDGAGFHVWRVGDRMNLMEFAPDEMTPVAVDTFYTAREPWRVVFLRGEGGTVSGVEVDFLRRTVMARKIINSSSGHAYVGTQACLGCHQTGPGGGPAGHWVASRHSRAFHTLTTDQAKLLVANREDYGDITDPSVEQRCLMCHVTAAQNPRANWAPGTGGSAEGVGCEACHGPGSDYMTEEVMRDRSSFLANGGRVPNELTCRECHRDEAFVFMERLTRIRH